jgi:hypothetical protein
MYAHVNTYRLGESAEVEAELASENVISDQTARTIASWYHSPADRDRNMTCLSHGLPFDTDGLRREAERDMFPEEAAAMLAWLDELEALLQDA